MNTQMKNADASWMIKNLRKVDDRLFGKLNHQYEQALSEHLLDCESVLDVGCGSESPLARLATRPAYMLGIDAFPFSLQRSAAAGFHDDYIQGDILDLAQYFKPNSFDCVFAGDVIEHLEKPDGMRLIETMLRLARRKVVLFTPNGFLPQGAFEGNPWQVHRSGWTPSEMSALGFKVFGMSGWKPLRGEYANPRWHPHAFWHRISLLTQPFFYQRPGKAFALLCIQDAQIHPR